MRGLHTRPSCQLLPSSRYGSSVGRPTFEVGTADERTVDRPLVHVNKKGRPVSQCQHCRGLRKARSQHVHCECQQKGHSKDDCHHDKGDGNHGKASQLLLEQLSLNQNLAHAVANTLENAHAL